MHAMVMPSQWAGAPDVLVHQASEAALSLGWSTSSPQSCWLQWLCGLEPSSKPSAYLPKTVFQKEIKVLRWEGRLKEPYSSEQGHRLLWFDSSFVQQNKTLCIPWNLAGLNYNDSSLHHQFPLPFAMNYKLLAFKYLFGVTY